MITTCSDCGSKHNCPLAFKASYNDCKGYWKNPIKRSWQRFRKKPIVVMAVHWVGDNYIEIKDFCNENIDSGNDGRTLLIKTLEGVMEVSMFDWIIKGANGEYYPCKEDIFKKTYDEVKDEEK